jgi:class 3 adenylate cyclase
VGATFRLNGEGTDSTAASSSIPALPMPDLARPGTHGVGDGSRPVTFLFTDIEGSTRLWEEHPDAMRAALLQHDDLLRACIESHGGQVFKTVGSSSSAVRISGFARKALSS